MISVAVEDFGPLNEASAFINLEQLRPFFNFLTNGTQVADLIAQTRANLTSLEKQQKAAGQSEAVKGNSVA